MGKQKFYVVWEGGTPGIYTSWTECQLQTKGYEGAKYKSFSTHEEAERAFHSSPYAYIGKNAVKTENKHKPSSEVLPAAVVENSLAVDAACSGNPGPMEYQCIDLQTGAQVFHYGPIHGTNNIGEFLAIVHALALMQQKGITDKIIYSDSVNAQLWVSKKQCKTKLERTPQTEQLYQVIARAENWLRTHPINIPIIKWETKKWGEIPADFGRKG